MQRGTDGTGAVVEYRDIDAGREHFLQAWQFTLDTVHGVDNVGTRLAEDGDVDALLIAGPGLDVGVFRARDNPCHILELDGCAVLVGNNQLRVVLRLEQLVVGRQGRNTVLAVQRTLGQVKAGLLHRQANIGQGQP